jgi:hypothetical protein
MAIDFPGSGNSLGLALAGVRSVLANNATAITGGSLTMSWVTSTSRGVPGFSGSWAPGVGPRKTFEGSVIESAAAGTNPLAWATRLDSTSGSFQILPTSTGQLRVDEVMAQLNPALVAAIEYLCGATIVLQSVENLSFGGPGVGVSYGIIIARTAADTCMVVNACINPNMSSGNNFAFAAGVVPVAGGFPIFGPGITVQSADTTPLDLDVAINNGANIFSVVSRTFTEPGP